MDFEVAVFVIVVGLGVGSFLWTRLRGGGSESTGGSSGDGGWRFFGDGNADGGGDGGD